MRNANWNFYALVTCRLQFCNQGAKDGFGKSKYVHCCLGSFGPNCRFIGNKSVNKSCEGLLLDIIYGIVGAIVGGYVFTLSGPSGVNGLNIYSLFAAVVRAVSVLGGLARDCRTALFHSLNGRWLLFYILASRFGVINLPDSTDILPGTELTLPILEEQLSVQVRKIVTGVVRLEKTVREFEGLVDQELLSETVSVEHVSLNHPITEPAVVRREGDVTIYPVMEEVLVVTKQLILKEEIRVTRHRAHARHQEVVPLRAEEVSIERLAGSGEALTQTAYAK